MEVTLFLEIFIIIQGVKTVLNYINKCIKI
jgi:hypothetical protein